MKRVIFIASISKDIAWYIKAHEITDKKIYFQVLEHTPALNSSYHIIIQYRVEEQLVDTAMLEAVLQAVLHVDTQAGTLSVPMVGKLAVRRVDTQAGTLSVPLVGKLAEL